MGMLFNSGPTLDILSKLNSYFGAANIGTVRGTKASYQNWPPNGGTYNFLNGLNPPLIPSSNPQNWKAWLGLLELHDNGKKGNSEKCVRTVGNAIYAGLNDNTYQAIEFFAVPEDSGKYNHISVEAFDVVDFAGNKTLVINAYTLTYDKLANTAH